MVDSLVSSLFLSRCLFVVVFLCVFCFVLKKKYY